MADAADLKSAGVIPVWVRIPPDLHISVFGLPLLCQLEVNHKLVVPTYL